MTDLLQTADEHVVANGYRPLGTAAGTTDLAGQVSDEVVTQQEVATAAGDTPVTNRKRLREIERWTSCAVTGVSDLWQVIHLGASPEALGLLGVEGTLAGECQRG